MNFQSLATAFAAIFCAILLTLTVGALFGYPNNPEYSLERNRELNSVMGKTLDDEQLRQLINSRPNKIRDEQPTAARAIFIILKWYWYFIPIGFSAFLIIFRPNIGSVLLVSVIASILLLQVSTPASLFVVVVGGLYGLLRRRPSAKAPNLRGGN